MSAGWCGRSCCSRAAPPTRTPLHSRRPPLRSCSLDTRLQSLEARLQHLDPAAREVVLSTAGTWLTALQREDIELAAVREEELAPEAHAAAGVQQAAHQPNGTIANAPNGGVLPPP